MHQKKPKVPDVEKARVLFELGPSQDGDLPELEDDDDSDAEEPAAVRMNRGRVIDLPAPGAPGGSIEVTSSTLDAQFMREFRDAFTDLVQNKEQAAGQS